MPEYSTNDLTSKDEHEAFYAQGSDRAIAILLGSIVENRLTALLERKMCQEPWLHETKKNLLRPSGPLGSFGTKLHLAATFSFLSQFMWRELQTVIKIRNKFAHDLTVRDFQSAKIADLIKKLETYEIVQTIARRYPEGAVHVSGIRFGESVVNDYRLCIAYYISGLRHAEEGDCYTAPSFGYFDT
jgi:hypothetical protein